LTIIYDWTKTKEKKEEKKKERRRRRNFCLGFFSLSLANWEVLGGQ
jgi:hypothetical protein